MSKIMNQKDCKIEIKKNIKSLELILTFRYNQEEQPVTSKNLTY